jgi:Transposase and inactivated derivatives
MIYDNNCTLPKEYLELIQENGLEGLSEMVRVMVNQAMKFERENFLNARTYERSEDRTGYANGYKPKTVNTRVGKVTFAIPQVREGNFYPHALEKGLRSERALMLALAEMYVQGVSTRDVAAITERLCGSSVSSMQVSRAAKMLDEELESWRSRPLGETPYLFLDARYEKVRQAGHVQDAAILMASGIKSDGKRIILGVSLSLNEAEEHWRTFLESLIARGLSGVQLIVSDDHAGLKAARKVFFTGILWQRCLFHLQQNAQSYVPRKSMQKQVAEDIRMIFSAPSREKAEEYLAETVEKYAQIAPRLADWMEVNLPEGFSFFAFPVSHWKRIRTSNCLERVSQEIKRRTRVVRVFPNESSCLRLVSSILMEIGEEWEFGRQYLQMELE